MFPQEFQFVEIALLFIFRAVFQAEPLPDDGLLLNVSNFVQLLSKILTAETFAGSGHRR